MLYARTILLLVSIGFTSACHRVPPTADATESHRASRELCRLGSQPMDKVFLPPSKTPCLCVASSEASTANTCGAEVERSDPRTLVPMTFGPMKVTVHPGEEVTFRFDIRNTLDVDLPLILIANVYSPWLYVRERHGPLPPGIRDMGQYPTEEFTRAPGYLFSLKPGARLWSEYKWRASNDFWLASTGSPDHDVISSEEHPLPAGKYVLHLFAPIRFAHIQTWDIDVTVVP